jgi:hypothetical protein
MRQEEALLFLESRREEEHNVHDVVLVLWSKK